MCIEIQITMLMMLLGCIATIFEAEELLRMQCVTNVFLHADKLPVCMK